MLGLRGLLEALSDFIGEDLKEMQLPVRPEGFDQEPKTRSIAVHTMRMPNPDDAAEAVPYILLQMLNGADDETEAGKEKHTVQIRGIITVYNRNPEEGALALVNIIERLRMSLLETEVIGGGYRLGRPFEWLIYPNDSAPYYTAEMAMNWEIPGIKRKIPFLR